MKILNRGILSGLVIMIFCYVSGSYAASFDCKKASTFIEKAICSDNQLSELDDMLMQSYRKAMAISSRADILKAEQRNWLINVRNKCQDSVCLKRAYNERLTVLNTVTAKIPKSNEGISIEGKYAMKKGNNAGEISVVSVSGNKYRFSIVTAVGAYACDEGGEILLDPANQTATFHREGCAITFAFSDGSVKIDAVGCEQSCGIGGYMDGVFSKVRSSTEAGNTTSVVYDNLNDYAGQHPEKGLFRDKKISPALKKLLGNHYQLFINNMDSVNLPEYTDGILIVTGGVPGLFTISEAILQIEKTGAVCVAILNDNKILYFTNSPRYRDSLPNSFNEWKSRFEDVRIINVR